MKQKYIFLKLFYCFTLGEFGFLLHIDYIDSYEHANRILLFYNISLIV